MSQDGYEFKRNFSWLAELAGPRQANTAIRNRSGTVVRIIPQKAPALVMQTHAARAVCGISAYKRGRIVRCRDSIDTRNKNFK